MKGLSGGLPAGSVSRMTSNGEGTRAAELDQHIDFAFSHATRHRSCGIEGTRGAGAQDRAHPPDTIATRGVLDIDEFLCS